jgi:hypothetical protein
MMSVNVTGRCAILTLRNLAYGCQDEPARTITPALIPPGCDADCPLKQFTRILNASAAVID